MTTDAAAHGRRRRLGVVGCGWVACNGYAPHLSSDREGPFVLARSLDLDPFAAARFSDRVGDGHPVEDLEALIRDVDAALIATPNQTHVDIAEKILRAGRPCLIEKPVAVRANHAARLRAAVRAGEAFVAPAVVCRYRDDVAAFLAFVQDVAPVRRMDLTWCRRAGIPAARWHLQEASDGWCGVLADLGYHLIDIAGAVLDFSRDAVRVREARFEDRPTMAEIVGAGDRGPQFSGTPVRAWARLDIGSVEMALSVGWAGNRPGDITRIVVHGENGIVVLEGLFGYSEDRAVPHQSCQCFDNAGSLVRVAEFPPGPALHKAAFGRMIDDFAAGIDHDDPSERLPEIEFTARLMGAINAAANT